jgi:hypothetical protein
LADGASNLHQTVSGFQGPCFISQPFRALRINPFQELKPDIKPRAILLNISGRSASSDLFVNTVQTIQESTTIVQDLQVAELI